jgi:hypothetical protein
MYLTSELGHDKVLEDIQEEDGNIYPILSKGYQTQYYRYRAGHGAQYFIKGK